MPATRPHVGHVIEATGGLFAVAATALTAHLGLTALEVGGDGLGWLAAIYAATAAVLLTGGRAQRRADLADDLDAAFDEAVDLATGAHR